MQSQQANRRDSDTSEPKSVIENNADFPVPPPSYRSTIYKLGNGINQEGDNISVRPPSYTDIHNPSVVYINNYPGPPLEDGIVQIVTSDPIVIHQSVAAGSILSKRMQIYFNINGLLMVIFGFTIIGLQIALIAAHSLNYYYYGFWAGAIIISIGLCTLIFNRRSPQNRVEKYFRSYIWQPIFVVIVFGFGLIIALIDRCDESVLDKNGECSHSYKLLNGLLIATIALTFVQSILNTVMLELIKRRYFRHLNSCS